MEKVMSYRKVERNIFDERFRVLTTYKKIIETELKYAFYDNRRVSIIRFDLHIPKLCDLGICTQIESPPDAERTFRFPSTITTRSGRKHQRWDEQEPRAISPQQTRCQQKDRKLSAYQSW